MVNTSVNNQAPNNLTEMFVTVSDLCKIELRNTKADLAIPHCRLMFAQKCFSHMGAKLWNDISYMGSHIWNHRLHRS